LVHKLHDCLMIVLCCYVADSSRVGHQSRFNLSLTLPYRMFDAGMKILIVASVALFLTSCACTARLGFGTQRGGIEASRAEDGDDS